MTKEKTKEESKAAWIRECKKLKEISVKQLSTEILLKELKDRGVIRSWYYNGTYHVGNELH